MGQVLYHLLLPNQEHPFMENVQTDTKNIKKTILGVLSGIFLIIVVLLVLDALHVISLSKLFTFKNLFNSPFIHSRQQKAPDAVIVTVGNENIYQKDLTTELAYFPATDTVNREKL